MNFNEAGKNLSEKLRQKCPLVHCITNYVTVNDCANSLLAIGASPIMADDIKEAAAITALSDALVLNIGTLNQRTIMSMIASGKKANEKGIPVIFDPVGAGASAFRNETASEILNNVKVSIIRGNLSELSFIAGMGGAVKGVDAGESDKTKDALKIGQAAAAKYGCVAAITGEVDTITDGKRSLRLYNGHKMLAKVTGTGCMTSALTAAFAAVGEDLLVSAAAGVAAMGISGEIAYEQAGSKGTGSFHAAIIDALSLLDGKHFYERVRADEN